MSVDTYLTQNDRRSIKRAEQVLQSRPWLDGPKELGKQDLLRVLSCFDVTTYWVELDGELEAGPWLTKQGAEDFIDQHILDRGVCDDAYDRVRQEYDISDADGDFVE